MVRCSSGKCEWVEEFSQTLRVWDGSGNCVTFWLVYASRVSWTLFNFHKLCGWETLDLTHAEPPWIASWVLFIQHEYLSSIKFAHKRKIRSISSEFSGSFPIAHSKSPREFPSAVFNARQGMPEKKSDRSVACFMRSKKKQLGIDDDDARWTRRNFHQRSHFSGGEASKSHAL